MNLMLKTDCVAKALYRPTRAEAEEAVRTLLARVGDAPRGVAILIEAEHGCLGTRGVRHTGVGTITTRFTGEFKTDPDLRKRFLGLAGPVANP